MASSLVCCFCGFHGSNSTINLTKVGVTAGFLLPFELGVVLVVVDLVVILWLVYDTSRERRKKKLYSIALVLARLVGLPSFVFVLRGFQPPSIPNSARDLYMGSSGNGPPGN